MAEDAQKKAELPGNRPGDRLSDRPGDRLGDRDADAAALPLKSRLRAAPEAPARPRRERRGPAVAAVPDAQQEAEKAKVVHIVRRLQEEANQKTERKRPLVLISVLAAVALPTLLVALYFLVFAADRYMSEARFALRSNESQGADVLGMISGMPASTITSDSYIVTDYVKSREMVELLEARVGLRRVYSHPDADFLTRLDPEVTLEGLIAYWADSVDIYYDSTKNTIAVQVQAFTAADAARLAEEILVIVRELVNELSAQARRDAVQFAAGEVARAELRVRGARAEMLAFRTEHNEFDPTATAASTLALTSQLEAERSQLNAQLAGVSGYLSAEAPSVQMLKSRIAALGEEIARVQNQISTEGDGIRADAGGTGLRGAAQGTAGSSSGSGSGALASVVGRYQEVLLSQQFAEQAYAAAQASLERARGEADRTQSYLAVYVHPDVAEAAAYPQRLLNTLIVLVISAILWAIGALAALTIRDHMP
jgi:capsular polysaccharide transport system permease protein